MDPTQLDFLQEAQSEELDSNPSIGPVPTPKFGICLVILLLILGSGLGGIGGFVYGRYSGQLMCWLWKEECLETTIELVEMKQDCMSEEQVKEIVEFVKKEQEVLMDVMSGLGWRSEEIRELYRKTAQVIYHR